MINAGIANYDQMTAQPRHDKLQGCMDSVEELLQQIKGAAILVKWVVAGAGFVGVVTGVVYTVERLVHHI